jgi:hypothetical protein
MMDAWRYRHGKREEVLRSWQTCGLAIDGPAVAAAAAVARWIGEARAATWGESAQQQGDAAQWRILLHTYYKASS